MQNRIVFATIYEMNKVLFSYFTSHGGLLATSVRTWFYFLPYIISTVWVLLHIEFQIFCFEHSWLLQANQKNSWMHGIQGVILFFINSILCASLVPMTRKLKRYPRLKRQTKASMCMKNLWTKSNTPIKVPTSI